MNKYKEIEEYAFYKQQLQQAKAKGNNVVAISTEFLDLLLNHTEYLQDVKSSYEAVRKAL